MLTAETEAARRKIPDAIRQAYSIVVTVNEANDVQAFKVAVSDQSLFVTIKADPPVSDTGNRHQCRGNAARWPL